LNYDIPDNDTDVCYDNDPANCVTYGRLYDWATAMGIEAKYNTEKWGDFYASPVNHKGICPDGWHIPNNNEWSALINLVGDDIENSANYNAGTKLKANSALWNTNTGTDDYDFTALPGGYCNSSSSFGNIGYNGYWHNAYETSARYSGHYTISTYDADVKSGSNDKTQLKSVRCVKD